MTQREELYKKRKELKEQIQILEKQVIAINKQIVESFPFKPGDKIRFKDRVGLYWDKTVEKEAWILNIQLNDYSEGYVTLSVNYPRKDGSRSERKNYVHGVNADDIEIIEKNTNV